MSIATGRVRGGQLVVDGGEGEPLPEGRRFTVVIEDEEGFHLDDESIRELREAQAGIRDGKFVTGEAMLAELDKA